MLFFLTVGMSSFIFEPQFGSLIIFIGLAGFLIIYMIRLLSDFISNDYKAPELLYRIAILLLSLVLAYKYRNWPELDYLGLVLMPITNLILIVLLIQGKVLNQIEKVCIFFYVILSMIVIIPTNAQLPRKYFPTQWYNRLGNPKTKKVEYQYEFQTDQALSLSKNAYDLIEKGNFLESLTYYKAAIEIEPKNPKLYFDISNVYANINQIEYAIKMLDTAIMYDKNFMPLFNNRGLYNYKLRKYKIAIEDFNRALSLDSNLVEVYVNLALASNATKNYIESCKALTKIRKLGYQLTEFQDAKILLEIRDNRCRNSHSY